MPHSNSKSYSNSTLGRRVSPLTGDAAQLWPVHADCAVATVSVVSPVARGGVNEGGLLSQAVMSPALHSG